jgi:hypothetical protein
MSLVGKKAPLFTAAAVVNGKEIVKDYIIKANTPLAGAQLKSNNAIRYIHSLNGWEVIGETEKLELLYHPGQIKNKIKEYLHERYKS